MIAQEDSLFTDKELKVARMKLEGRLNRQIAEELGVTEEDISQTLSRVRSKINKVGDSIELFKSLDLVKSGVDFTLTEKGRQLFTTRRVTREVQKRTSPGATPNIRGSKPDYIQYADPFFYRDIFAGKLHEHRRTERNAPYDVMYT